MSLPLFSTTCSFLLRNTAETPAPSREPLCCFPLCKICEIALTYSKCLRLDSSRSAILREHFEGRSFIWEVTPRGAGREVGGWEGGPPAQSAVEQVTTSGPWGSLCCGVWCRPCASELSHRGGGRADTLLRSVGLSRQSTVKGTSRRSPQVQGRHWLLELGLWRGEERRAEQGQRIPRSSYWFLI